VSPQGTTYDCCCQNQETALRRMPRAGYRLPTGPAAEKVRLGKTRARLGEGSGNAMGRKKSVRFQKSSAMARGTCPVGGGPCSPPPPRETSHLMVRNNVVCKAVRKAENAASQSGPVMAVGGNTRATESGGVGGNTAARGPPLSKKLRHSQGEGRIGRPLRPRLNKASLPRTAPQAGGAEKTSSRQGHQKPSRHGPSGRWPRETRQHRVGWPEKAGGIPEPVQSSS